MARRTQMNATPTAPSRRQKTELSVVVTGFKLKFEGRALLVLALGIAAAMGGTIIVKLVIF